MRESKGLFGWLFGRLSKGWRRKSGKGHQRAKRLLGLESLEHRNLLSINLGAVRH